MLLNSIQEVNQNKEILIELDNSELLTICFAISHKEENNNTTTQRITEKEKENSIKAISIINKRKKPFDISPFKLAEMQLEDETLQNCIANANNDKIKGNKESVWVIHKDCLHRIRKQNRRKTKSIQLVLPLKLREDIMIAYHDELLAAHCGYFKTAQKIAQWYWWPNMHKDIKQWVKSCVTCQKFGKINQHKEGKMAPVIATRPFQIMGMDIMIVPPPATVNNNRAIVVFTDYYTKWVEAFAIPDEKAETVALKLIQGVLCRHGASERIISDRGTNFTSDVFREVTEMLGMKQSMTSGYHPQADGQTERAIGTLKNTLSKLMQTNHDNWDTLIPYALWAYRTAVHSTTKETPYFLIYGREATNPADIKIRQWMEEHTKIEDYTAEVAQRLINAQERVIKEINKAKDYDKERFDKGRTDSTFKQGEIVWLQQETTPEGQKKKFRSKYIGPYIISKIITGGHDLNVEITHSNNENDIRTANIRKLKRAILRPNQIELIPKEIDNVNIEKQVEKNKEINGKLKVIKNPKGKTPRTQRIRAGKAKIIKNKEDKEYEMEGIVDEQIDEMDINKPTMYLVKWLGFPSSKNTWEYENAFKNAQNILREWNRKKKILNNIPEEKRKAKSSKIDKKRIARKKKRST